MNAKGTECRIVRFHQTWPSRSAAVGGNGSRAIDRSTHTWTSPATNRTDGHLFTAPASACAARTFRGQWPRQTISEYSRLILVYRIVFCHSYERAAYRPRPRPGPAHDYYGILTAH
jgi:hypothetical protein